MNKNYSSCCFFPPSMLPESPPDSSSEAWSPAQIPGTIYTHQTCIFCMQYLHFKQILCFHIPLSHRPHADKSTGFINI